MALSRVIDPATRDYVPNGRGGTQTTEGAAPSVYHHIAMRRGSNALRPTLGSRFHELELATADAAPLAEQLAVIALQPLVDAGQLRAVEVAATADARGKLDVRIEAQDTAGALDTEVSI